MQPEQALVNDDGSWWFYKPISPSAAGHGNGRAGAKQTGQGRAGEWLARARPFCLADGLRIKAKFEGLLSRGGEGGQGHDGAGSEASIAVMDRSMIVDFDSMTMRCVFDDDGGGFTVLKARHFRVQDKTLAPVDVEEASADGSEPPKTGSHVITGWTNGAPYIPMQVGAHGECPDHLVLSVHGIGQKILKYKFGRDVYRLHRECQRQRRHLSSGKAAHASRKPHTGNHDEHHQKGAASKHPNSNVLFLPVTWRKHLDTTLQASSFDEHLASISLKSYPALRLIATELLFDILFYATNGNWQALQGILAHELNEKVREFKARNEDFKGTVSLLGHSLGGAIISDLVSTTRPDGSPWLDFDVNKVFCTGCPFGAFLLLRKLSVGNGEIMNALTAPAPVEKGPPRHPRPVTGGPHDHLDMSMFSCQNYYNVFHAHDPLAHRIEPLLMRPGAGAALETPVRIKSLHPISKIGRSLKHRLTFSGSKGKKGAEAVLDADGVAEPAGNADALLNGVNKGAGLVVPGYDHQDPVAHAHAKHMVILKDMAEDIAEEGGRGQSSARLKPPHRIDYQIEAPGVDSEYLGALRAHVGYWRSQELARFVLEKMSFD